MKLLAISIIYIIVSFFASQSIGLFEIPDAYFYYVLGHFLLKGQLLPVAPLNAEVPQTLFGPVYAIFSYPLVYLSPGPQFTIPFIQLLLIGISAICIFYSVRKLLKTSWSFISITIFLLLPFNILYAFVFMSEVFTLFLVSLYLLIYTTVRNNILKWSLLICTSALLSLTRYAFIPWVIISGLGMLYVIVDSLRNNKWNKFSLFLTIPSIIGVLLLLWWISFNYRWYNKPMLSSFTGRHLYNNVITAGKLVPTDKNNPHVSNFLMYLPQNVDVAKPWWDMQPYFAQPFYEKKLTEMDIDNLFLQYSLAGIKQHPFSYVYHIGKMAFITPNTSPYFDNVLTQLGYTEENCPICHIKACRFMWIPDYCKPLIPIQKLYSLFANAIIISRLMYPILSTILMCVALIGSLTIFYQRKKVPLFLVFLFIMQHIFQSSSEWVEGRFLLPLYPIYTVLIVYGIIGLQKSIKKIMLLFEIQA